MKNAQNTVREWMEQFGQDCPEKAEIPSLEIRKLRARLMLEECLETISALGLRVDFDHCAYGAVIGSAKFNKWGTPNLAQIQDGCSDLHVVTLGTEVACGLQASPAFNEVMRSNFSKMWTEKEVTEKFCREGCLPTGLPLKFRDLTAVKVKRSCENDRCWVVKDSSGKALKSPSYSPANLKPLTE